MPTTVERKPHRFANYRGKTTPPEGRIVGPNALGELLVAVTEDYDEQTDTTRIGYAYATPDDVRAAADGPLDQLDPVTAITILSRVERVQRAEDAR